LVKFILISLLLLNSGISFAQKVISSAGTSAKATSVQLFWTIGEPVVKTFTGSTVILTQGFHQSWPADNQSPVAHAGSGQTVNESTLVTLDGSASFDPDGDALTFHWTSPAGIILSSATAVRPVFVAPEVMEDTQFSFLLVVNDGSVDSPADQVVITVTKGCVFMDVHVYLEGALVSPEDASQISEPMRTTLNDKLMLPGQTYRDRSGTLVYTPAGQPYNEEPWLYYGTEGAAYDTGGTAEGDAGYPETVVDWVLVSLRLSVSGVPLCRKAALVHRDGTIEIPGGFGCCSLDLSGSYYLVIEHRNHLLVMSPQTIKMENGMIAYDFRMQQSYLDQYVSRYVGQKLMGDKFAMYAGNGEQNPGSTAADTDITGDDQKYWGDRTGRLGFLRSDYNLNGDTNANDQTLWEKNNGLTTGVPRN